MRPSPDQFQQAGRSWMLLAMLALVSVLGAVAADAPVADDEQGPVQLAVLVEWIELDHREANTLLRKFPEEKNTDATGLRDALEAKLDTGEAELHETAFILLNNGQRSNLESTRQLIYPAEFDADRFQGIQDFGDGQGFNFPPPTPSALLNLVPEVGPFEYRSVGTSVEVEANLDADGRSIGLNLYSSIVRYLGTRKVGDPKLAFTAYQPVFNEIKSTMYLAVADGGYAVLGVHRVPGAKDKRFLTMVRANVLR